MLSVRFFLIWLLFVPVCLMAQPAHSWLRKGDSAYGRKNFSKAEDSYRRALEKKRTNEGTFNLGNAIYRQERYDESAKHFEATAEAATGNQLKAKAFHNLGNAHFLNKEYGKSVEAYKKSLRLNPTDFDTKKNLAMALQQMKLQQQQQQNQQNQQNQQQKDQQNQQHKDQQQNQQDQQPGQPQTPNQKQQKNQEQPEDLSKEEARQLLQIMDQEEQKVQQNLRKGQTREKKVTKDW
ncbi:MAG: tetratricopeptide repeat protein [Saprospiraceae bacterium]|nr:MAG: tetratricopeptide repeat protein [Saprospiraceae bacterium]